jgi:hypothetical protein
MNDWSDVEWIERFHEDRLDESEVQAFARRLRTDPSFTRLYSAFLSDEVIFIRAIESLGLDGSVGVSRGGFALRLPNWDLSWAKWPASVVAVLMILFLSYSIIFGGGAEEVVATVDSAPADAVIRRDGERLPARTGVRLRSGDTLIAGGNQGLSLTYNDGTVLTMRPNCRATFKIKGQQKFLYVFSGMVMADVAVQAENLPMVMETPTATATVMGTSFTLAVSASDSRIDVRKGRVHFANTTGSEDLVHEGEFAIASPSRPVIAIVGRSVNPLDHSSFARWRQHAQFLREDPALLAYYDFQEEGTTPGRLTNRAHYSVRASRRDGKVRKAIWLDGRWPGKRAIYFSRYGYVDCGNGSVFDRASTQLTAFVWVRLKKFFDKPQFIFGRGNGLWRLEVTSIKTRKVRFICDGLKGKRTIQSRSAIDDDRWHLLVGVYNGENVRLYIDDTLEAEGAATGTLGSQRHPPLLIGSGSSEFEGWVDEAGVLDRALSEDEVIQMFRAGRVLEN